MLSTRPLGEYGVRKDYVSHQVMGSPHHKPLINISLPHAIFPYATMLSTKMYRDCLNRAPLQCMANVLGRLPVLRTLFYWMGSISASKRSIITAMSKGHNI